MITSANYDYGVKGRYFLECLKDNKPMVDADKIKLCAMDRFEILMAQFEKALDWCGIIPGINVISSAVRFLYATTQLVVAIACKIFGAIGIAFANEKNIGKWVKFDNRVSHHMWQAGANQLRALGEVTPVFNLLWIPAVVSRDKFGCSYTSVWKDAFTADAKPVKLTYNRNFYEGELKLKHIINNLK